MMKKSILLIMLATMFAGCAQLVNDNQNPRTLDENDKIFGKELPAEDRVPEMLNIEFTEEMTLELERNTGEDGLVRLPEVKSVEGLGIVKMRRVFPYAGKFEPRTRREGLHRWYRAYYDAEMSLTKAAQDWSAMPGVVAVEFVPKLVLLGDTTITPVEQNAVKDAASSRYPFDDPRLPSQWHYLNKGTVSSSVSGCDINVVPVWQRYTTGSEEVIVAVCDGGIDFKHEDLAGNMWENPEKKGDNRFGYNFYNDSFRVKADDHGTHVAGTISAVNNNGIGVSGIAGGNAAEGIKGVSLMSCQIFDGDSYSGRGEEAIKWAADHGAVICQNSWGTQGATETSRAMKKAVDYFVTYAGVDENDVQTGPMRGGLVVFSAGNDAVNVSSNSYEKIMSVAAVGADFRRAFYSSYGDWVTISAPGGDVRKGNQVLSTISGNKYGFMQGTSMAAPHVSGVAALVVSHFGGKGFTREELWNRLVSGATPIRAFNKNFGMGAGLVNAYRSIAGSGGQAPDVPEALAVTTQSNSIHFSVTVPTDVDDVVPTSILVYYSPSNFSTIGDDLMFGQFYLEDKSAGDRLEGTISGLDFLQRYYVAVAAVDLAGNCSPLSARSVVTTGDNNAPLIEEKSATEMIMKPHEIKNVDFAVSDPDGHFYNLELECGDTAGIVLDTLVREMPKIVARGPEMPSGAHSATLVVTDTYGASSSKTVKFTVLENHAPVVKAQFEDRLYASRAAVTEEFVATDYFSDEDGEELSYTFEISNENVINMTYQDGRFFLTPMNFGYAVVKITGTDVRGASASQSFRVLIRDGAAKLDVYPNPVSDYLYVRTGETAEALLRVINVSGASVYEQELTITPFDPAQVDMRTFAPGIYTVLLDYDGEQIKKSIVKL